MFKECFICSSKQESFIEKLMKNQEFLKEQHKLLIDTKVEFDMLAELVQRIYDSKFPNIDNK